MARQSNIIRTSSSLWETGRIICLFRQLREYLFSQWHYQASRIRTAKVQERRKSENKKQVRQSPFSTDCLACFYVYLTSFRRFFKKPSLPHWTTEGTTTKFEGSYPQISAFYRMHGSEKMVPYQRARFLSMVLTPPPLLTFVIGTKYTIEKANSQEINKMREAYEKTAVKSGCADFIGMLDVFQNGDYRNVAI